MEEQTEGAPWLLLLFGLAFIAGSFWVYFDLAAWEAAGGSRRINWLFAFIYRFAGKWGVALAIFGIGAGFIYGYFSKRAEIA